MFTNGNSVTTPTLNVNGTGDIDIKVVICGNKAYLSDSYSQMSTGESGYISRVPALKTGTFRFNSSSFSEMWQPYTVLDLMYDGTDWVIMGNPVVESFYSINTSNGYGYRVYADGKIEQWGYASAPSSEQQTQISFPIQFSNKPSVQVTLNGTSDSDLGQTYLSQVQASKTSIKFDSNYGNTSKVRSFWYATGY